MNRIKSLLVATFILLSTAGILISCGGGEGGSLVGDDCSVPTIDITYDQAIADIEQRNLYRKVSLD